MGNRVSGNASRLLWLLWVFVVLVDVVAFAGVVRLRFDDGLQAAFASDDQWYRDYAHFSDQFTQSDGDVAVLFRAKDFADPAALRSVSDFVLEAQLVEGVEAAYSIYALPADVASPFDTALPANLPERSELATLLDRLIAENPAAARLMTAERDLTAVYVTMESGGFALASARQTMADLDRLATEATEDAGVSHMVTGLPALRIEIIDNLFADLWRLNLLGAAIAFAVCAFALRSIPLGLVATLPSGTALVWSLGAVYALGFSINVVTIALPVLVMVLSFTDSLHLTFEARRLVRAGIAPADVPLLALRRVGGACALATLTTAFAFAGLLVSESALIRDLGLAGILATLVALAAVLCTQPLLVATVMRFPRGRQIFSAAAEVPTIFDWRSLPGMGLARPALVAAFSAILLGSAAIIYPSIEPVYSFRENISETGPVVQTFDELEARLTPVATIDIPVRLTRSFADGLDRASIDRVRFVQEIASEAAGGAPALSIASLANDEAASPAPSQVANILSQMTDAQRHRLISVDGGHALVRLYVPDKGAAATRALVERITAALAADPRIGPGVHERPTGFLVMSSFLSAGMILDLNLSFLVAVAASGIFIALWFRNLRYGLVALIPNLLPILMVGSWLALSGNGLQFSSGIALTIAFGIAVDDTVHILNRLRLNAPKDRPLDRAAVAAALNEVTPVLVITTAVLSFGLLGTQVAAAPTIAWFGSLSIAVFLLAILADLVVLPAWLVMIGRFAGPARTR